MQADSVVELQFVLDQETPSQSYPFGTEIKGYYLARVRNEATGNLSTVHITNQKWINAKFKPEIIALVQRNAIQLHQQHQIGYTNQVESGFTDVEEFGIRIPQTSLDNRQIYKVKYIPKSVVKVPAETKVNKKGKKIVVKKGKTITTAAKWIGLTKIQHDIVELEEQWVRSNFPETFIQQVRANAKQETRFLVVPPGDSRPKNPEELKIPKSPTVPYKQDDGSKTCLIKSLASALAYLNYSKVASELNSKSRKFSGRTDSWDIVFQWFYNEWQCFQPKNYNHNDKIDLLTLEPSKTKIIVAGLVGSDGKTDHVVAITDNWIFDSNVSQALPLTEEGLNTSCRESGDNVTQFVTTNRGIILDCPPEEQYKIFIQRKLHKKEKRVEPNNTQSKRSRKRKINKAGRASKKKKESKPDEVEALKEALEKMKVSEKNE